MHARAPDERDLVPVEREHAEAEAAVIPIVFFKKKKAK